MKKICKECGKEFEASNARQQYCSRQHFRPCPVCGKPVAIKYLSDPTPKCSDCKKHRTISIPAEEPKNPSKAEIEYAELKHEKGFWSVGGSTLTSSLYDCSSAKYVTRKYVGRTTCGFITNHIYTVALIDNAPGKLAHAKEDQTSGDDLDIGLGLSNESSWNHFFKVV